MTDTPTPSWQEGHDALQKLYEQLDLAYDNAVNMTVATEIDHRLDRVKDALDKLNQQDMASRTIALQATAAELVKPLKDLDALKGSLEAIGNDIGKAATVLAQVDKLLGEVTTCFGI